MYKNMLLCSSHFAWFESLQKSELMLMFADVGACMNLRRNDDRFGLRLDTPADTGVFNVSLSFFTESFLFNLWFPVFDLSGSRFFSLRALSKVLLEYRPLASEPESRPLNDAALAGGAINELWLGAIDDGRNDSFFTLTPSTVDVVASIELLLFGMDDIVGLAINDLLLLNPVFNLLFVLRILAAVIVVGAVVSSALLGADVVSVEQLGFGSTSVSVDGLCVNDIDGVDEFDGGIAMIFSLFRLFFASIFISVKTLFDRVFSSDESRFGVSVSVSSRPDDPISNSKLGTSISVTVSLVTFISELSLLFSALTCVDDDSSSISLSLW